MHPIKRARARVHYLLFSSKGIGKAVDSFIITLIAVNVVMVIIETEDAAREAYGTFFETFDIFSSLFFTVEYVLRAWACVDEPQYQGRRKLWARLRYSVTPMALIDLVAILPFWLPLIIDMDLRFVRALRLFRLFRLFKIGRYASAIAALARVFSRKKEQLAMTFFTVSMMLILFSSVIYFIEHPAQPEDFRSIVDTMWWTVVTLTTVGYGDVVPITSVGKFVGSIIAFMGVIIIALPSGIVASGFAEEMNERRLSEAAEREAEAQRRRDEEARRRPPAPGLDMDCPHCGVAIALHIQPRKPSDDAPPEPS